MDDLLQQPLKPLIADLARIAIAAANPADAVKKALSGNPLRPIASGRYMFIAVGKAATAMMEAALAQVPAGQAYDAIIVTNYENAKPVEGAEVFAAGHPAPDANGLEAAERVEALLKGAGEADQVVCLISGGGSAVLPAPAGMLTLEDKAEINQMLLSNGFDISEMNSIRQCLSRLKGGGLARAAAPASVISFILSDVVGDDVRVIASGLTATPIATRAEVAALLIQKGLFEALPSAAKELFADEQAVPSTPHCQNHLIGSNRLSLDAVIQAVANQNANPEIELNADPEAGITLVSDRLIGDVSDACAEIVSFIENQPLDKRRMFIWGGETTVSLAGSGKGGRNQELALRVALAAEAWDFDWAFGSIGTDGRDGPTDAAGAIVDGQTGKKIRDQGTNPINILKQNDSYHGLEIAGDLLKTGPTGTNVADIQILVCQPRQNLSD